MRKKHNQPVHRTIAGQARTMPRVICKHGTPLNQWAPCQLCLAEHNTDAQLLRKTALPHRWWIPFLALALTGFFAGFMGALVFVAHGIIRL